MSLEFNRRSFLKYSAAAAVAVAGSSLLTGCGEDEYQKTGKIGSTLKLMGTFKMYDNSVAATAPSATNASASGNGTFVDRKSTRLNSSHNNQSRMPSSA